MLDNTRQQEEDQRTVQRPVPCHASYCPPVTSTPGSASPASSEELACDEGGHVRSISWYSWTAVVFHAFLSFVICNVDRINLSVAILPMATEFSWSQTKKGIVQAAFFCGYISTGILGGRVADRIGGRRVLAFGVASWSIMTFLTPIAAHLSFPGLLLVRMLLGIGEGVAMPAMNALVKSWVPTKYISRSLAFIYSGMHGGSILGLLLTPPIITAFGWESVFYISGLFGLAWALIFLWTTVESEPGPSGHDLNSSRRAPNSMRPSYIFIPEDPYIVRESESRAPETSVDTSDAADPERSEELETDAWVESPVEPPTLRHIISHKAVWAVIVAHFCTTWGYFVLLMWLPSYFASHFDLTVTESAQFSVFPWVLMFFFTQFAGFVADSLLLKGYATTRVRKVMQAIAFLGPAFFLSILTSVSSKYFAIGCIAAGLGLGSFAHGGVYCVHQDIAGKCAGTLLGISNTFASIPGIVGVGITGFILDRSGGNWNLVFFLAVSIYLFGCFVFTAWGSSKRIFA
jgi:MFS transporter, ACS family, solute carrier family 17 (sodium-dependent inorganic phosphate cotransporter), other